MKRRRSFGSGCISTVNQMAGKCQTAVVLFSIVLLFKGAESLRDVNVKIPMAVTPGDTVTLHCQYDLENDPLYTVKWYKGRQEFFRYIPKELPHTRVFLLPGVNVDVSKSGAHEVVLRNVQLSMAGKYRCEVSADAPSFHTTMVSGYMHVVYLPDGAPKLTMEKQRYSIGETLRGNCSSPPAHPPANLTWIVNGKEINESFLIRTTVDNDIPIAVSASSASVDLFHAPSSPSATGEPTMATADIARRQTTVVGLELELTADNFLGNRLRLECVATVLQLYKSKAELVIEEEKPRLASVLSTRDTNNSACHWSCRQRTWIISLAVFTASKIFSR